MANDGGLSSLICFGYLIVSFRECDGIFLWPTAFRAADTLIETAKMNGVNPEAWLVWVLERIQDHPAQHITELMPWAYQ